MCITCFFIGLIFTTGAGEYWLKMFDSFAGTIGLVVVALTEMIAVVYVYGYEKFTKDIYDMTGHKLGWFWLITWRFLAPAIMFIILVSSIIFMFIDHPKYQAWNKDLVSASIKLLIRPLYKQKLINSFLRGRPWPCRTQDGL